jgi:hypothetical protein
MVMGLVKGEGFAVDASVLEANASRYHGKAPEELDWSEKQRQTRAVAELSLPETLSGKDSPELWNRGMLAGDGYDSQAADRGATRLYYVARAA